FQLLFGFIVNANGDRRALQRSHAKSPSDKINKAYTMCTSTAIWQSQIAGQVCEVEEGKTVAQKRGGVHSFFCHGIRPSQVARLCWRMDGFQHTVQRRDIRFCRRRDFLANGWPFTL